jgi:hypothetical protein
VEFAEFRPGLGVSACLKCRRIYHPPPLADAESVNNKTAATPADAAKSALAHQLPDAPGFVPYAGAPDPARRHTSAIATCAAARLLLPAHPAGGRDKKTASRSCLPSAACVRCERACPDEAGKMKMTRGVEPRRGLLLHCARVRVVVALSPPVVVLGDFAGISWRLRRTDAHGNLSP